MIHDFVSVSASNGVAVLTLDDPDRRNCLSDGMVSGIDHALRGVEADPAVRAVVVTGAGSAFCAGATPGVLHAAAQGDFARTETVYNGFLRVLRSPLLTIAAVNGPAVGAGLNLALACDLRLAGPSAVFESRFSRLQLHPGGGHLWLLQRAVGYQQALLGVLCSQSWDAQQALRSGMVVEVADDVVQAAVALGERLHALDPALSRRLLDSHRRSATALEHAEALDMETAAQRWSMQQEPFVQVVEKMTAGRTPAPSTTSGE